MDLTSALGADGVAVLTVVGEIDVAVADDLHDAGLDALSSADCDSLVLDLGAVAFIDSTGLGALVGLNNAATKASQSLWLRNLTQPVQRVLAVSGLESVLQIEGGSTPN